jgi:ElaB/YqjD/DUF883 family membrane-anchored ribosome-binding protein
MSEQEVPALEVQEAPPVEQTTETPAPAAEAQNEAPENTPDEAAKAKLEQQKLSRRERQRQRDREEFARKEGEYQAEIRMLREQQGKATQPVDAAPKREDFDDFEAFLEAKAAYKAEQIVEAKLKEHDTTRQGKERESADSQAAAKRAQEWAKREADYIKANPDYTERVTDFLESGAIESFTKGSREYLVESGPALVDYLATHTEDAERIAQLSPLRQIAELGKLEIKLEKAPPKPSDAPPPAKPIASARSSGKDITKMTAKEIEADMKARGSKWVR